MIVRSVVDGFKVMADMQNVEWKLGDEMKQDMFPKLLQIRDNAGQVVGSMKFDFAKLPFTKFDEIINHIMDSVI